MMRRILLSRRSSSILEDYPDSPTSLSDDETDPSTPERFPSTSVYALRDGSNEGHCPRTQPITGVSIPLVLQPFLGIDILPFPIMNASSDRQSLMESPSERQISFPSENEAQLNESSAFQSYETPKSKRSFHSSLRSVKMVVPIGIGSGLRRSRSRTDSFGSDGSDLRIAPSQQLSRKKSQRQKRAIMELERNVGTTKAQVKKLTRALAEAQEKMHRQQFSLNQAKKSLEEHCSINHSFSSRESLQTPVSAGSGKENKRSRRRPPRSTAKTTRKHDVKPPEAVLLPEKDKEVNGPAQNKRGQISEMDATDQQWYMKGRGLGCDNVVRLDDINLPPLLDEIVRKGYALATDEASYTPTNATKKVLQRHRGQGEHALDQDVLVWTSDPSSDDLGSSWPIIKGKVIVKSTPKDLVSFMMDASQIKKYNKMNQLKKNLLVVQEGVETPLEDSNLGVPGDVRISTSVNKPKLLPKSIKSTCLWHYRPVEGEADTYISVSRSVWESIDCEKMKTQNEGENALRSDMILGVQLIRPIAGGLHCEMTTVTHVVPTGVPEQLAKRMTPVAAANMLKDIKAVFQ